MWLQVRYNKEKSEVWIAIWLQGCQNLKMKILIFKFRMDSQLVKQSNS